MSSAQVLRQAEGLKASVADTSMGSNEAWVSRQALQDLYQSLLVMDLEYALDKKVEQDLWNHAFKNQINSMQTQAKDKQNPKRGEIQSSLNLFLETASGFYLQVSKVTMNLKQLLQELCSAFKLDLPFRRKSSKLGILKEYGPLNNKLKMPKKSSSRYRQQIDQAQTYYRHAAQLVPYNGQPYNQLAILEAAKGNKLSTVFYYIRSVAVKHPFPVASTNLEKFYAKISKEILEFRGKLSLSEIIASFLQFHAFIHLCSDMDKAKKLSDRLVASLPTHITSMSFSAYQMVQMVAINLFALHHAQRKFPQDGEDDNTSSINEPLGTDEEKCYEMVFSLTMSLFDNMLHHTPKQEQKAKEYHTLPALKIILDWLRIDSDLLSKSIFKNSTIWPNLSKLLNNLQFHANQKEFVFEPQKCLDVPLPEDCDLQCFSPVEKAFADLDFLKMPSDGLLPELELRLRCHRMVEHGLWISEEFPSLNLMNFQKLKSSKLQFSAPTAQVKVLPGTDGDTSGERKSIRQNVAIQAIMQKKSAKRQVQGEGDKTVLEVSPTRIQNKSKKEDQQISDTGIMVHTSTDMSERSLSQEMPALVPSKMSSGVLRETSPGLSPSPHSYLQAFRQGGSQTQTMGGTFSDQETLPGMGMLPFQISSGTIISPGQQSQFAPQIHPGLPQGILPDSSVQLATGITPMENSDPQGHYGTLPGQINFQGLGPPPRGPVGSSQIAPGMSQLGPFTSHPSIGGNQSPQGDHSPTQGLPPPPHVQPFPQPQRSSQLFGNSSFPGGSPSPPMHISPSDSPTQALFGTSPLKPPLDSNQQSGFPLGSSVFNTPPRSSPSPTSGPLGRFFSGSSGQESNYSPGPWMSRADDFRETGSDIPLPDMAGLTIKPPDSDLTSAFPASSRMAMTFPTLALPESVPKPDSPPTVPSTGSVLFPMPGDGGMPLPTTSNYSLFQSPWSVQITTATEGKPAGMRQTGFDHAETTLHSAADDLFRENPQQHPLSAGFNPLGYTFGSADGSTWASPPSPNPPDTAGKANTLLSSSIQSLWSSGPSPLEKLLEQQKQQRHGDPH